MRQLFVVALVLVCCAGPAALAAAESPVQLSLNDGRVLSGEIVAESASELRLLVSQGKMSMEVRIDPDDIVARETLSDREPAVQRPADRRRATAADGPAASEAATATAATAESADHHQRLRRALGRHLFDRDGQRSDAAAIARRPYLLLYFSASWCGPCRSFTPTLVDYYRKLGEDRDVEIVMISRDKDSDRMLAYMKKYDMPWAALPMGSRRSQAIDETYGGAGIPCLTLLGPDDEILAHSYVDGEYYGPNHVLRAYEEERGKRFLAQSLQAVKGERRAHALLRRLLADDLIDGDGAVAADELGERRYLCLYFSASWCKPCRKFTPKLKQFYRRHGGGEAFDVVFVSSDREAKDMQRYFRGMPWLAARFGSMGAAALSARFAGPGIPCLVLLDATGRVVAHSYRGEDYVGPYAVLKELERRVGG